MEDLKHYHRPDRWVRWQDDEWSCITYCLPLHACSMTIWDAAAPFLEVAEEYAGPIHGNRVRGHMKAKGSCWIRTREKDKALFMMPGTKADYGSPWLDIRVPVCPLGPSTVTESTVSFLGLTSRLISDWNYFLLSRILFSDRKNKKASIWDQLQFQGQTTYLLESAGLRMSTLLIIWLVRLWKY